MPKVRYVGPFDEVLLPTLGIEVVRGGEVDVDELSFANLVEQHDWEAVEDSPRKPAKAGAQSADAENGAGQ